MTTKKVYMRSNSGRLNGPEALYVSVMAIATDDMAGRNGRKHVADALAYFAGPVYRHHVTSVGYPVGTLPREFEANKDDS